MRNRISVTKENRIWEMRCQGYTYAQISEALGTSPHLTRVLRRIRRRPSKASDPVRRGRRRWFLDDRQVGDIRRRVRASESVTEVSQEYWLSGTSIRNIARGKTYTRPEYGFKNRLVGS